MKLKLSLFALACLLILPGCGFWKKVKSSYQGTVLPAEVELEEQPGMQGARGKLAQLFCPLDQNLEFMLREIRIKTDRPQEQWLRELHRSFSWVNGVAVVDRGGSIQARYPQSPVKPVDYSSLVRAASDWQNRKMRTAVQKTELGPEVFVLRPFFERNEWQGLVAVHFDPRTLARMSPQPDDLLMLGPDALLWGGRYNKEGKELSELNWKSFLESDVNGHVTVQGKRFYWLARFVGSDPLIYAVESGE